MHVNKVMFTTGYNHKSQTRDLCFIFLSYLFIKTSSSRLLEVDIILIVVTVKLLSFCVITH